jgi:hypothetical protein
MPLSLPPRQRGTGMSDRFIPHMQTCEADHPNTDYGKCGEPASAVCFDDFGRERFVCSNHFKNSVTGRMEAELATLRAQVADYEEVLADKKRLAREIDIAIHGEPSAAQPSLCDLIGPIRELRTQVAERDERLTIMEFILEDAQPDCELKQGFHCGVRPGYLFNAPISQLRRMAELSGDKFTKWCKRDSARAQSSTEE